MGPSWVVITSFPLNEYQYMVSRMGSLIFGAVKVS